MKYYNLVTNKWSNMSSYMLLVLFCVQGDDLNSFPLIYFNNYLALTL